MDYGLLEVVFFGSADRDEGDVLAGRVLDGGVVVEVGLAGDFEQVHGLFEFLAIFVTGFEPVGVEVGFCEVFMGLVMLDEG